MFLVISVVDVLWVRIGQSEFSDVLIEVFHFELGKK
jgi:hypothetical protein